MPPTKPSVMITLRKWFNPWGYWADQFHRMVADTYRPEFGSYWQPKAEGGLYLQQAESAGYQMGYREGMADILRLKSPYAKGTPKAHVKYEYRLTCLSPPDDSPALILAALQSYGHGGWGAIAICRTPSNLPEGAQMTVIYFERPELGGSI